MFLPHFLYFTLMKKTPNAKPRLQRIRDLYIFSLEVSKRPKRVGNVFTCSSVLVTDIIQSQTIRPAFMRKLISPVREIDASYVKNTETGQSDSRYVTVYQHPLFRPFCSRI